MRPDGTEALGQGRSGERKALIGLARACAGALIFALPLLMTMEMWWIGFSIDHWRLIILAILLVPLLVGLSHFSGFEETEGILDDTVDAFVAIAVGATMAAVILFVFGVIRLGMPAQEVIGKIALQTFPASIGAMLARICCRATRTEMTTSSGARSIRATSARSS
jgi:putative integral membrane protein (TIGR02587 family)